jgi:Leucine-rich repeat (LRR) protein
LADFQALSPSDLTDQHLAELASLDAAHREQVVKMDLGGLVTDEGARHLPAFVNLAELSVGEASISKTALDHLKALPNLKTLSLDGSGVADDSTMTLLLDVPALESLSLEFVQISDDGLKTIAQHPSIKRLTISPTGGTGAGLAALADMRLEGLRLDSCQNMPGFLQGLAELARCRTLQEIDLSYCSIGDEHLVLLKSWPQLRSLNIRNNGITDQGMLLIKPLNLVELVIDNNQVTDLGISQIGSRGLQRLSLAQIGISDAGMQLIKRFPALVELNLSQTGVGDFGLLQLKGLKNLQVLNLDHTQVTDRGLAELVSLKSLKRLHLAKTNVTDEGRAAIQRAIPDLVVVEVEVEE